MPEAEDVESLHWFEDGYAEGQYAADVNLEVDTDEVLEAYQEDKLGELAGEVREHASQMAGDISYDIDQPGGPTEEEFESWENGFYQGFYERVHEWAIEHGVSPPTPYTPESYRTRLLSGIRVKPYFRPRP